MRLVRMTGWLRSSAELMYPFTHFMLEAAFRKAFQTYINNPEKLWEWACDPFRCLKFYDMIRERLSEAVLDPDVREMCSKEADIAKVAVQWF